MRAVGVTGALVGVTLLATAGQAVPIDGAAPILCALSSAIECSGKGQCERSTEDAAHGPVFVRVKVPRRAVGAWVATAGTFGQMNARSLIHGPPNDRVWSALLDELTNLPPVAAEDDGAIVLSGACISP